MRYLVIFIIFAISFNTYAEEIYLAKFQTLNGHFNGTISGSTTFNKIEDKVYVFSRLFAGTPETWHMQNIYTGRCPDERDDTNFDGTIDINEAAFVVKNIIIPLDGDINSQMGGMNIYPVGDMYGSYFYEKEAKYSNMMKDLKSPDTNPDDNIIKLEKNEKLILEGKVVLVQGTSVDKTLPIACGTFRKIRDN